MANAGEVKRPSTGPPMKGDAVPALAPEPQEPKMTYRTDPRALLSGARRDVQRVPPEGIVHFRLALQHAETARTNESSGNKQGFAIEMESAAREYERGGYRGEAVSAFGGAGDCWEILGDREAGAVSPLQAQTYYTKAIKDFHSAKRVKAELRVRDKLRKLTPI